MGLQNYNKNPNRRNTLQLDIWHISSHLHQNRAYQPQKGVLYEHNNDDKLRLNLDCLEEVRDQASQRMAKYHQKMAEYYNQKVKLKRFHIGDLVLRKVTLAMKDPAQGKLGPTWEGPYRVVHYSQRGSYHLEDLDENKLPRPQNVEHLKRYYEQELQLICKQLALSYTF